MALQTEYWLSIDLSSDSGSLAIHSVEDGKLRLEKESFLPEGGKHSEALLPSLQNLLANAKIELNQIRRFVTSSGPGSFTGLRIAFASLKAFSYASGATIEVVSGHEARALNYLETTNEQPTKLWVQTQIARQNYLQTEYARGPSGLDLLQEIVGPLPSNIEKDVICLVDKHTDQGTYFPLTARALGENLLKAKTRRSFTSWDEIANASPEYFGSKNY